MVKQKVMEVLVEREDEGDTFVPAEEMYGLLEEPREAVRASVWELVRERRLVRDQGAELYRAPTFRAEVEVAARLAELRRVSPLPPPAAGSLGGLTDLQRRAVSQVLQEAVSVILGAPGTGKTSCIAVLARLFPGRVALCAPTGKASRRLGEATGREAYTLHRLLGYDGKGFRHGPGNPLPADLVVVDEASMLDVHLAAALLGALRPGARLCLVGDPEQLCSVGPGQVLSDLVRSGLVAVTRLRRLHRQARKGPIARRLAQLRGGRNLDLQTEAGFTFLPARGHRAIARAVAMAERLLGQSRQVAVLAPTRAVVTELNRRLQMRLNPPRPGVREVEAPDGNIYRERDQILFMENDYVRDFRNGQLGVIKEIKGEKLLVATRGRLVEVALEELEPDEEGRTILTHGWALTAHRAQGSEWEEVVVCVPGRSRVLSRAWLYATLSRARHSVILVGHEEVIRDASIILTRRRTKLLTRLRQALG